jgi:hypothetical protein
MSQKSSAVLLAAALAAVGLVATVPAAAQDNAPSEPKGCGTYDGGSFPNGMVIFRPPGYPPLPDSTGQAGYYMCIDGRWILVGPAMGPGGVIYMEGGPSVTVDAATLEVDEGGTATNTGMFAYDGEAPVTFEASVGTVTSGDDGTWSWSYSATDGPTQTQSVLVKATAAGKVGGVVFDLTVGNVAPEVVSIVPSRTTAVVGQPVTFVGYATDVSMDDASAGFTWAFDGTAVPHDSYTTSFAECGSHVVTATATDKDLGTSAVATSQAVSVFEASLGAPLRPGGYNLVQAGQVVPVRVEVGCKGVKTTGLSPSIQLLSGNLDPEADDGGASVVIATTDAPGADTGNVMRAAGSGYIYNLRVPKAPSGSVFTVRVSPFGDGGGAVTVALRIR